MKVLKHSEVKNLSYLPRLRVNVHGKKWAFIHYMITKCSNPNCQLYHPPATEIGPWYAEAVCRTIESVLDHIMKQVVSGIQMAGTKSGNQ